MRKCIFCGSYEENDKGWCPKCFKSMQGEPIIDTAGFELVDVADPIFDEGE